MLYIGGGLQSMATLLQPETEQAMFYDAADAFMTMLDVNDQVAVDPIYADNLISLVTATETYGVVMDSSNLAGAMDALATMELSPG